jgi:hypothetical protein
MGGSTAPFAAIAAALFALALAVPASAATGSPIDAASAVQTLQQRADAVAGPAVQPAASAAQARTTSTHPPAVLETVKRAAGRTVDVTEPTTGTSGPATPARAARKAPAATGRRLALAPVAHGRGLAHTRVRRSAKTSSHPPHGRKGTPAARSIPERARAPFAGAAAATTPSDPSPPPDQGPGDTGTANGTAASAAQAGLVFAAFLLAALVAVQPFLLGRFQVPAPSRRRLAFVSAGVPPG